MTTWHRWPIERSDPEPRRRRMPLTIGCGSCRRRIKPGQVFARIAMDPPDERKLDRDVMPRKLVRCESCWDLMQLSCPWPREERTFDDDVYAVPAPTLPAGFIKPQETQPFETLRNQVRRMRDDVRARQMKDAS